MASDHIYVLVTGANSGVGFGICCHLIDDFLRIRPSSGQLTIIYTTRNQKKGLDTLHLLETHLKNRSNGRIHLVPENVDLTKLRQIRALAKRLCASGIPKLDAIILNAGNAGAYGLNWPLAIWQIITENAAGALWPRFKLSTIGSLTQPQLEKTALGSRTDEPPLGEVFCANVFGHYLLAHWLMPLLRECDAQSPARMIWSTSIEPDESHFDLDDLQGIKSAHAYEHSKRLLDLLTLTAANQPATIKNVQNFLTTSPEKSPEKTRTPKSQPVILNAHPGVPATGIISIPWIMMQVWIAMVYVFRFMGSPWHTCTGYAAAISATWLALSPMEEIEEKSGKHGKGSVKWGSAVDRLGHERVELTDVQGWGVSGSGEAFTDNFWDNGPFGAWGRKKGSTDATREQVEAFVTQGATVWQEMEQLRQEWEERIEEYEKNV